MCKLAFFLKLFYIRKNRSKIGTSTAEDPDPAGICFPFVCRMNDRMLLNGGIALDQMDIHFFKKMFFGRKNGECLGKETADGLKGTGAGGVDGDDQFLYLCGIPVFQRFQKEKLFWL